MKKLNLRPYHDISEFAHPDQDKCAVNNVYFTPNFAVASDGNIAMRVPFDANGIIEDSVAFARNSLVRVFSANANLGLLVHKGVVSIQRVETVKMRDVGFSQKTLDSLHALYLTAEKAKNIRVVLSSRYLRQMADFADKHGSGGAVGVPMAFHVSASDDPVRITIPLAESNSATALLMPMSEGKAS